MFRDSDNNDAIKSNVEKTNLTPDDSYTNLQKPISLSEEYKEASTATETKVHKIQIWAEIRPSLHAIEDIMSSRVKKVNLVNNVPDTSVRKKLPSIEEARPGKGASEEDSEEEFYDLERSESDPVQDTLPTVGVPALDPESLPPWKEELELLVQGGVPMALRGEVCISRQSLNK